MARESSSAERCSGPSRPLHNKANEPPDHVAGLQLGLQRLVFNPRARSSPLQTNGFRAKESLAPEPAECSYVAEALVVATVDKTRKR